MHNQDQPSTPQTATTSGSLATPVPVPVPWKQHRAVCLAAIEMCKTLQLVDPVPLHTETLAELTAHFTRWESFQQIVAEAEAEYEAGHSLDSLTGKQGNQSTLGFAKQYPTRPGSAFNLTTNMDCERQEQLYNLDAHEEGSDAAEGGLNHTANPYTRGTDDFYAWRLGWKEVTDMLELDKL